MTNTEAQQVLGTMLMRHDLTDAELEAIGMAGEALEDDWIPVEEDLPEDNQAVLVSVDRCFVNPIDFAYRNNDKWFFVRNNDIDLDSTSITIFAWRPLPKIYKYWEDKP